MQLEKWPKRLYILDVSRGFAALAVVFWHWQHFAFAGSTVAADFDPATQPWYGAFRLLYESGWVGVNYFSSFRISGG
jgi:peptidoglycan/LPS O-acetylase OafA/YrhL